MHMGLLLDMLVSGERSEVMEVAELFCLGWPCSYRLLTHYLNLIILFITFDLCKWAGFESVLRRPCGSGWQTGTHSDLISLQSVTTAETRRPRSDLGKPF